MISASQQVNKLGKYLYRNIDSAEKLKISSNICDVYFTIYYQIPAQLQDPAKGQEHNDVHEMLVDLNITTYQNKIRVNLIEISPQERTIGFDVFEPEDLQDLKKARIDILNRVKKRVSKAYSEFDFLF